MMREKIKQNIQLQKINRNKIWLYGVHSCIEALLNENRKIYEVRCKESIQNKISYLVKSRNLNTHFATDEEIFRIVHNHMHQGIALCCDPIATHKTITKSELEGHTKVLILDHLTDVNNIGSIMRSMAANGFTAIITTKANSPNLEKCGIKSACGGLEHLAIFEIPNLVTAINVLKKSGFWCVGLDHRAAPIAKIRENKIGLIIGSEDSGIRELILKSCDEIVSLETNPKFPVLNAAVAAAIAMYWINCNSR